MTFSDKKLVLITLLFIFVHFVTSDKAAVLVCETVFYTAQLQPHDLELNAF